MLAELEVPHELSLSPSGHHVVYTLRSEWNRPHGRWVSALWVADVGKPRSARRLTDCASLDMAPRFSSDGQTIAFLSDLAMEGVTALWTIGLDGVEEAHPLTDTACERGVQKFAWSGDGKFIAFLSVDEKTPEQKARKERKDDARVYGQEWDFVRLRVVEVATGRITKLPVGDCQVFDFAWSPDSKSIAYATNKTPEAESAVRYGITISVIGLEGHRVVKLAAFPGLLEDLSWVLGDLWWRAGYEPSSWISAKSVYKMSVAEKNWRRYSFGEKDCATPWLFPPGLRKLGEHSLVVQVQEGLADQLHLLPEGRMVYNELHEVKSWDAAYEDGEMVLVVAKSSGNTPREVYSIVGGETICLSYHGETLAKLDIATAELFYAKAQDGSDLDGVLVVPKDFDVPKPWPTIVLAHGGPYPRVTCSFDMPYFNWSPWFTSAGYAVLCVNYRGGSSHGEAHASAIRGAAGTVEYSDMIDLVKAGIERGTIDKHRVGLAGWSYGGYLGYLAVTRDSTFHFQAAMCGAGITDWDLLNMTTQVPLSWAEISGHVPWGVDKSNTNNRQGSPIWHMQDIKTPILIIHGDDDTSVPVTQAKTFHQGCLHLGFDCEMVIYPREGHAIFPPFEKAHYIDMLERMKIFFDRHLGMTI
jgi:dipeptidyl aminopeptidase/acylaminoacyl peptidase